LMGVFISAANSASSDITFTSIIFCSRHMNTLSEMMREAD
jgi:hypothetical protein